MDRKLVLPEKETSSTSCSCCGEAIYDSMGFIVGSKSAIADYWIRWSPAHKGNFSCAITLDARTTEDLPIIFSMTGRVTKEGVTYTLLDRKDTWWNFEGVGYQLSREEALVHKDMDRVFKMAELLTDNDCRIALNVFEQLGWEYPGWTENMCEIYLCAYDLGLEVPTDQEVIFPVSKVTELPLVLLNGDKNFIGITDASGISLQFYRNEDRTITIDVPMPAKSGSYQKDTDLSGVEKVLEGFNGKVEPVINMSKLELVKW